MAVLGGCLPFGDAFANERLCIYVCVCCAYAFPAPHTHTVLMSVSPSHCDIDGSWMLFYSAASHSCQQLPWRVEGRERESPLPYLASRSSSSRPVCRHKQVFILSRSWFCLMILVQNRLFFSDKVCRSLQICAVEFYFQPYFQRSLCLSAFKYPDISCTPACILLSTEYYCNSRRRNSGVMSNYMHCGKIRKVSGKNRREVLKQNSTGLRDAY